MMHLCCHKLLRKIVVFCYDQIETFIYCLLYFAVAKRMAKVPFIPGHECVGEVSVEKYVVLLRKTYLEK